MTGPGHSPLPWHFSPIHGRLDDANGDPVEEGPLDGNTIANTRLIVTTVNSHAALLAAGKKVIATRPFAHSGSAAEDAVKSLKAAIAAAEDSAKIERDMLRKHEAEGAP